MQSQPVKLVLPDTEALSRKSDEELRELARATMTEELQERLEALAEAVKTRTLSESEKAELAHLMKNAESVMLLKAEVFRLLAERGQSLLSDSAGSAT